jgi:tRNA pseudouridine38-40 synthase
MKGDRTSDMVSMRTLKLVIEYDGTNYLGWQVQAKGPTIQGLVEEKLALLTGDRVHLTGSGRTDSGVHALMQVAHFRTASPMAARTFEKALNSLLPRDIVIRSVEEAGETFHARKSCRSKIYEYRILNRGTRSAFHRLYAWHIRDPLNLDAMRDASRYLPGEHDFASFRSMGTPTATTVRRVDRAEWKKEEEGLLLFEIEANGFLKQMVRAIVGTLVDVGRGKISLGDFQQILESRDRKEAGPTAPARGLFLKEVKY